jgi:hypothetical protein
VSKTPLVVFTALGLALALHLMPVLFMAVRRVFTLTQKPLIEAETGASQHKSSSVTSISRRTGTG